MSTYEAAYKPMLQGVSQQIAAERLEGQVSEQINMMSDPVTGLRRRPGAGVAQVYDSWAGLTTDSLKIWFTDIAGQRVHICVNTTTGSIRILNEQFNLITELAAPYLAASNPKSIRGASVGSEFFILNTERVPSIAAGGVTWTTGRAAFFYVASGAFSKQFTLNVSSSLGTTTATYTTPSGTGGGDAALSTPEYIAGQLANQITTALPGLTTVVDGSYVFVYRTSGADNLAITTSSGSNYIIASAQGMVRNVGELPARLPPVANGFVVRVGTGDAAVYYKYDSATTSWLESAANGSPAGVTNVPGSVFYNPGTASWGWDTSAFEGRLAGDDANNPAHAFMSSGITGMGTYQGRLVLLSGSLVSLSSSANPRRFFRSTVTNVVAADPIEIGSSMASSAAYEWAIPFQKDLLLFSRSYQAVLPANNQVVTAANATVVPTSSHEVDTTSSPITIGRTLMYCSPKSSEYFGVLEMLPSDYTDSQYISQDSTPHLPRYLRGRCRFAVASSVSNMALFAPSADKTQLVVHEYQWDGSTKVQQAWHTWQFPYPVSTAYFASDVIVVVFAQTERMVICTIDPRADSLDQYGAVRPFSDLFTQVFYSGSIVVDPRLVAFDPAFASKLSLTVTFGDLLRDEIGFSSAVVPGVGTVLTPVPSFPTANAAYGIPYRSSVKPSPPSVKDFKGGTVHSGKATVLRFTVGTLGSHPYYAAVSDPQSAPDVQWIDPLSYASPELAPGRSSSAKEAANVVPARTTLRDTELELYTAGTGELNITWLEYVVRYHPKLRRWGS